MDLIKIGKLINVAEFEKYIEEAEKMENILHVYGTAVNIPDYPCWMMYEDEGDQKGTISFTRHTYKHPVLKEMVDKIVSIYSSIFPEASPPLHARVHLMRTTGNLPVHRDEAGRMSCINLGIKNSSGAVTAISTDGIRANFKENSKSLVLEDGCAYLLNTNEWHSVRSTNDLPRYLITYGFETPFDVLRQRLRFTDETL